MANNRYNQKGNVPDYRPKEERDKKVEIPLNLKPCLKCGKAITTGYYAHYEDGGVCSKKCDDSFVKPKEIDNENFVPCTSFHGAIFAPR